MTVTLQRGREREEGCQGKEHEEGLIGRPPSRVRQRWKKASRGTELSGGVQNLGVMTGSARFWLTTCLPSAYPICTRGPDRNGAVHATINGTCTANGNSTLHLESLHLMHAKAITASDTC